MKKILNILMITTPMLIWAHPHEQEEIPDYCSNERNLTFCDQLADSKEGGKSLTTQADELTKLSDSIKPSRQLGKEGLFTDSRWGDDGNNFQTNYIQPVDPEKARALTERLDDRDFRGVTENGEPQTKAKVAVRIKRNREGLDRGFGSIAAITDAQLYETDVPHAQAEAFKTARDKYHAERRKTPQNAEELEIARKGLVASAVDLANHTDDDGVRRMLLKPLRQITESSQRLQESIALASKALTRRAQRIKTEAREFKNKILDWFQLSGDPKRAATDRASVLSDLIMLKADLVIAQQSSIRDDIYREIENSILGKFIEKQIKEAKKACGDARALKDISELALLFVCDPNTNATNKVTRCDEIAGQIESMADGDSLVLEPSEEEE
jgi:hypothetical protein